jgi:hypothetical protein
MREAEVFRVRQRGDFLLKTTVAEVFLFFSFLFSPFLSLISQWAKNRTRLNHSVSTVQHSAVQHSTVQYLPLLQS